MDIPASERDIDFSIEQESIHSSNASEYQVIRNVDDLGREKV